MTLKHSLISFHLFAMALLIGVNVSANQVTQSKFEFENKIRDRVSQVVNKVDPSAIVQVQIQLKQIESELAFLGPKIKVTPLTNGELGSASFRSVTVKVITQIDELPEWIKTEIKSATRFGDVPVTVNYVKADGIGYDPSGVIGSILREKFWPLFEKAFEFTDNLSWKMAFALTSFIIAMMLCFAALVMTLRGSSQRMAHSLANVVEDKIVPALSNIQTASSRKTSTETTSTKASATTPVAASLNSSGSTATLSHLPAHSLTKLFTDCYWTENDEYANYLWSDISVEQKQELLDQFFDPKYFTFFNSLEKVNLGYHQHPWYLKTEDYFPKTDQLQLSQWLKKNNKQYHLISPMRFDELDISLELRINLFAIENTGTPQSIPELKDSALRKLPTPMSLKRFTIEDEQFIYENHNMIGAELRPQLASLVWLAHAPAESIQDILSEMDARQLAEAWYGPEDVLNEIEKHLPGKKLEMLKHFLKEEEPTRQSDSYQYLVNQGLQAYNDAINTNNSTNSEAA